MKLKEVSGYLGFILLAMSIGFLATKAIQKCLTILGVTP